MKLSSYQKYLFFFLLFFFLFPFYQNKKREVPFFFNDEKEEFFLKIDRYYEEEKKEECSLRPYKILILSLITLFLSSLFLFRLMYFYYSSKESKVIKIPKNIFILIGFSFIISFLICLKIIFFDAFSFSLPLEEMTYYQKLYFNFYFLLKTIKEHFWKSFFTFFFGIIIIPYFFYYFGSSFIDQDEKNNLGVKDKIKIKQLIFSFIFSFFSEGEFEVNDKFPEEEYINSDKIESKLMRLKDISKRVDQKNISFFYLLKTPSFNEAVFYVKITLKKLFVFLFEEKKENKEEIEKIKNDLYKEEMNNKYDVMSNQIDEIDNKINEINVQLNEIKLKNELNENSNKIMELSKKVDKIEKNTKEIDNKIIASNKLIGNLKNNDQIVSDKIKKLEILEKELNKEKEACNEIILKKTKESETNHFIFEDFEMKLKNIENQLNQLKMSLEKNNLGSLDNSQEKFITKKRNSYYDFNNNKPEKPGNSLGNFLINKIINKRNNQNLNTNKYKVYKGNK